MKFFGDEVFRGFNLNFFACFLCFLFENLLI